MGDKSKIEWTDATWNPVVGCTQVSPGCDHCYAKTLHNRRHTAWQAGNFPDAPAQYHQPFETVQLLPERLEQPPRWRKPRRIFVNSLSDLFHADVPDEFILKVFDVMRRTPQHTYQILTKRPQRMRRFMRELAWATAEDGHGWLNTGYYAYLYRGQPEPPRPLPNVWLGVSVESNAYVFRAEMLRETPAAVKFISAEPLLGKLDGLDLTGIDWLIAGGESGGPDNRRLVDECFHELPDERAECEECEGTGWAPSETRLAWVRDLRDRCQAAGVAFLFKQWGGPGSKSGGRLLDGRTWDQYPAEAA